MTRAFHGFAVMVVGVMIGCGGDDRPSTAPDLPIVEQAAKCSEYDAASDGTVDEVYTYEYDADGFVVKTTGSGGDVYASTYDDDHFLLDYAINTDADATLEAEYVYTRDSYGRVLTYDERNDDALIRHVVNTYDDRGRIQKQVSANTPADGMTSPSTVTIEFTYKGDSKFPTSARQTSAESQIATSMKYTTSADQRMVHIDYDQSEDGTVEGAADYTYDADGHVLTYVTHEGTKLTYREAHTYNKRGSSLTFFQAYSESGPDAYQEYSTYDAAGMRTKNEAKSPSGDAMDSVYTENYKDQCATPRTAPVGRRRVPATDPSLLLVKFSAR